MKKRKFLFALACVGILCMSCAIAVCAEETEVTIVDSGTCGENLTWELDSEGTLTISGTGDMVEYSASSDVHWQGKSVEVKNVVISDGVTSIGNCAFRGCSSLTSITIPDSVTSIGDYAFYGSGGLKSIIFMGAKPTIGSHAFYAVTAYAYYPESLEDDTSWTEETLGDYGGTLTWKTWWTLGDNPLCNHVFTSEKVVNCTTISYTLNKCECGYSYRSGLEEANGHDMVVDVAVAATCTETGLTEGSHCSRCDYKIEQKVTDKLGHDMVVDAEAVAATCTETGLTEGSHCSRCDYKITQEVTDKIAHDMVVDAEAVAATCTETGLTEGSHCSRCYYKIAQKVVPTIEHTAETDAAVEASCSKSGLTEGSHCSVCGKVLVKQNYVERLEHTYELQGYKNASCSENGYTGNICLLNMQQGHHERCYNA